MVEAAIRSAEEHRRVTIAEILDDAYERAVGEEADPVLRRALESWPSVHAVVQAPTSAAHRSGPKTS
jgi:hypothetical protein